MQRNLTKAGTAEKIKNSIQMIELRLKTNRQILEQSIKEAQNNQQKNKIGESECAIEECKAAIRKLEFIQIHSEKIDPETTQHLIQRYNEMAIAEIKNTIQLAIPIQV